MLEIMGNKAVHRYHVENVHMGESGSDELIISPLVGPQLRLSATSLTVVGAAEAIFMHAEVAKVHWMSKGLWNPIQADGIVELKHRRGDSIVVDLRDGRSVVLSNLGSAYSVLFDYLHWYVCNYDRVGPSE